MQRKILLLAGFCMTWLAGCATQPETVAASTTTTTAPAPVVEAMLPVVAVPAEPVQVLVPSAAQASAIYLPPELEQFAQDTARERGVSLDRLREVLSSVSRVDKVLRLTGAIAKPRPARDPNAPKPTWRRYLNNFLSEPRPSNALIFAREHSAALAQAEAQYGVPQAVILSIIGVETHYGRITGTFRIVDALYTLGFYDWRRKDFFRSELAALFELEAKTGIDVDTLTGSFAGAMGYAQFMPSSYLAYAVDFNHDGQTDLIHDPEDAIGSVAAYLSRHGWKADAKAVDVASAAQGGRILRKSRTGWSKDLAIGKNFRVIKRYNNSDRYALAVALLAHDIDRRLGNRVANIGSLK